MKKVLFATTALVATAGVASADVALSGSAEMGVVGGSGSTITQFHQDIDVTFTMSGETDGGITFGAAVDLDESTIADSDDDDGAVTPTNINGAFDPRDDGGVSIFISGDFGTLTMGDTDGGFDAGMQEVNIGSPGSIDDAETTHAGYTGNNGLDGRVFDGQVLSYSYSVSGFTITGSVEMDDDRSTAAPFGVPAITAGDGLTGDAVYGIGASYAGSFGGGSYTIGGGYQVSGDTHAAVAGAQELSVVGISATVALDNGLSGGLNYSQYDYAGGGAFADFSGTHTAVGVSYTFDMITVHANYGMFDWDATATVEDSSGYGLAASYDLGGGLSAHLGYGNSEYGNLNAAAAATPDSSQWSLGLSMSF